MNRIVGVSGLALLGVFSMQDALANLDVRVVPSVEASQVGTTSKACMGVEGRGRSDYTRALTVAAGATLECEGSTLSPINIQQPRNVSYPLPGETEVNVLAPPSGEGQYEIAGFNTWELNVAHLCNVQMKASATESVSSITGNGYFFTLSTSTGGPTMDAVDVKQFYMFRLPPPAPWNPRGGCYF